MFTIGTSDENMKLRRNSFRAEVNGWWPGKVVNLMMREEGKAMAQVTCTSTPQPW